VATVELRDICLSRTKHGQRPLAPLASGLAPARQPETALRDRGFSIQNLNLTVPDGKTVVILGPSGCGKTTLLRIAAGLQQPDSGQVLFDGVDARDVRPRDRGIGMVFQGYALYPFTSRRNILSYFMFRNRTPELDAEAAEKYRRTCDLLGVEIEYLADRDIRGLSGGEKQRVALGRCITRDPRLFLLDEPFSSLDAKLREKYRFGLRTLLQELEITTIYVTHDQQEALVLADLMAIMNIGTIEQVGTPQRIYELPNSMFVADFLNFSVDTPAINFLPGASVSGEWQGKTLGIRPEDVELDPAGNRRAWTATITSARGTPMSRAVVVTARLHDQVLYLRLPTDSQIETGREIGLKVQRLHVFDADSGRRIETVQPSSIP
jgi:multiple sugar transport system ATP-binding protein